MVHQINYFQGALKLKQIFQKDKAVTDKTPLFVIGPFCSHYFICLNIGFWQNSVEWKWCVFNLSGFNVTWEIYGYPLSFCNKKVREMSENSGQNFSCVFHDGFRFEMSFLTKEIWLSLWKTQDVSLLGSNLTTLKSYALG